MSERAVMYKAKESEIFSGREIYRKGRIEYLSTGYITAVVRQPRGGKATKKCVEQARERVLILYSKANIREISEAIIIYAFDGNPSRNLASLGIIVATTTSVCHRQPLHLYQYSWYYMSCKEMHQLLLRPV